MDWRGRVEPLPFLQVMICLETDSTFVITSALLKDSNLLMDAVLLVSPAPAGTGPTQHAVVLNPGVSLETHTLTHPCPLLQRYDFRRARADYHGCVDLLSLIPNNRSVGFRFPCMDGQNTPSPRAYAEIMNGVSDLGNFMTSSTSVGVVFTPDDPNYLNQF